MERPLTLIPMGQCLVVPQKRERSQPEMVVLVGILHREIRYERVKEKLFCCFLCLCGNSRTRADLLMVAVCHLAPISGGIHCLVSQIPGLHSMSCTSYFLFISSVNPYLNQLHCVTVSSCLVAT